MSLNKSKICYLKASKELIGRSGHTLNIITGCKHGCSYCYARKQVEADRFGTAERDYPYGFEPTFHPERIRHYGGKSKLIFVGNMGDVGCDTQWRINKPDSEIHGATFESNQISFRIKEFANLNPEHIILLLTKRPEWYGLQEWPDNIWCGFTATNQDEFYNRSLALEFSEVRRDRMWVSLEPWLDEKAPKINPDINAWFCIGGQSNPDKSVSMLTMRWLYEIEETQPSCAPRIFVKRNAAWNGTLRQYPEEWKVA